MASVPLRSGRRATRSRKPTRAKSRIGSPVPLVCRLQAKRNIGIFRCLPGTTVVQERREQTSRKWRQALTQNKVEKLLRDVDRFSSEKNEDAEEFLETLDDKVLEGSLGDFEIWGAILTVLRGKARRWWRTSRDRISTWAEIKTHFRRAYVREFGEEDLWSDLRHRRQAEKEKISTYTISLRHIVRHLAYPSERYLALLAYRNLHSTYRDALANRVPMSLDELEEWRLQSGKLENLNCR